MRRGQVKKGAFAARRELWRGPENHRPWGERLRELLARIQVAGSHGLRHCDRSRRVTQWHKDQRRAIAEGYCMVTPRVGTAKQLVLTDAGRAYMAGPVAAPAAQPYARRRAGMAEFNAANGLEKGNVRA